MPSRKFCWDTSVFIAMLAPQFTSEEERAGISEVVALADSGQVIIVTSTIAMAEVLGEVVADPIRERFEALFQRPNFVLQDANPSITQHAGTIRVRGRAEGRRIHTPDATFIATALAHRVEAFHTLDEKLLKLSASSLVDGLVISRPHGTQMLLDLGAQP